MVTRTLHLITSLGAGGAERSLAELLPDLRDRDVEPIVVVFHRRSAGVEHLVQESGVELLHVEELGWTGRVRAIRHLLDVRDPHVLHTSLFEADVVGRLATLGARTTTLTSLVNTSYEPVRLQDHRVRRSRLRVVQAIDATSARLAGDHFHAISEAVRQSAIERLRLRPDRITVVHRGRRRRRLGEPGPERRRSVRQRLGLPSDAVVLLHVGREEYQKGHDVLLDAVAPLLRRRPDVHLVLAGRRGNSSEKLDELTARAPDGQIHRLGHVDEVPDLLAAADIFVFPSRYEGLGGAALEAMAMEVPIVASDLPALREFLDGIGQFVEPSSASSLGRGLDMVLADLTGARERAVAGRKRFDATYEHHHIVDHMAELFHRCAATS